MTIRDEPMTKEYFCDTCHESKHLDEMAHTDAEICEECHEKWFQEQIAYWKPLYDAEKRAGLLHSVAENDKPINGDPYYPEERP